MANVDSQKRVLAATAPGPVTPGSEASRGPSDKLARHVSRAHLAANRARREAERIRAQRKQQEIMLEAYFSRLHDPTLADSPTGDLDLQPSPRAPTVGAAEECRPPSAVPAVGDASGWYSRTPRQPPTFARTKAAAAEYAGSYGDEILDQMPHEAAYGRRSRRSWGRWFGSTWAWRGRRPDLNPALLPAPGLGPPDAPVPAADRAPAQGLDPPRAPAVPLLDPPRDRKPLQIRVLDPVTTLFPSWFYLQGERLRSLKSGLGGRIVAPQPAMQVLDVEEFVRLSAASRPRDAERRMITSSAAIVRDRPPGSPPVPDWTGAGKPSDRRRSSNATRFATTARFGTNWLALLICTIAIWLVVLQWLYPSARLGSAARMIAQNLPADLGLDLEPRAAPSTSSSRGDSKPVDRGADRVPAAALEVKSATPPEDAEAGSVADGAETGPSVQPARAPRATEPLGPNPLPGRQASRGSAERAAAPLDQALLALAHDPDLGPAIQRLRGQNDSWEVLYEVGHQLRGAGHLDAAILALERASALNPHHAAIAYDLGYALQHNGDFEAATENYRRAIAANPRHAFALYNLAFLLQERQQRREASNLYARAAEIMPDNPHLLFNWAVLLQDLGDTEHALQLYRRIAAAPVETRLARDARARMATLEAMKAS